MKQNEGGIELSRPEIAALLAHASSDETRPHICCVHFRMSTSVLVETTDGHRLARLSGSAPNYNGPVADWLASREVVEAAADSCRRMKADFVRFMPPGYAIVSDPGFVHETVTTPTIAEDVKFPPTDHVIPTYSIDGLGLPSELNGDYIADLGLVAKAANAEFIREMLPGCKTQKERAQVRATHKFGITVYPAQGELDPVAFTCGPWLVIIMPRRMDSDRRCFANIVSKAAKEFEDEKKTKKSGRAA